MMATTPSSAGTPPSPSAPATSASSSSSSALAAAATTPAKNTNSGGGGGLSTSAKIGIGVGVGVVALAAIIGFIAVFLIFRRAGRRAGSDSEGDVSSEGKERSVVGSGGVHSNNEKTDSGPVAGLGRGKEAGVGGAGVGGGAYSYNYSSGYDRGGFHQQVTTGQDGGGGGVGGQNGERRHEDIGAQGPGVYHLGEPHRSDRAPDQRLRLDLGVKW